MQRGIFITLIGMAFILVGILEMLSNRPWKLISIFTLFLILGPIIIWIGVKIVIRHIKYE